VQLLLDLLAAVEDGAVPGGAEDVLVEAALAALTLCPQCTWFGGGCWVRWEGVGGVSAGWCGLPRWFG